MKTKIKLLIADSNRELLMQMKSFFDGKGDIELIAAASDGLDASEKIRRFSPDVVLMDIVLPQLDGIGLLKAIRSFDMSRGFAFSTYAVPLIIGEIRRFLRDDGLLKVSRIQKRLGAVIMHEREKYISENGNEPRLEDLAKAVGVTLEEAALALDSASPVRSLSEVIGDDDFSLEDVIPSSDDALGKMIENVALCETINKLPPLWRQIITLRYFRDYSQQQTADALGLTQVKISREEKKIFSSLRAELV